MKVLQIVILWFLCFYTTHMQCQLCWWNMQRKVYLKEMNANDYQLLFPLMYILKVCLRFGVHRSLIMTKNVCRHLFFVIYVFGEQNVHCSGLIFFPLFSKKKKINYVFQISVLCHTHFCYIQVFIFSLSSLFHPETHTLRSLLSNYNFFYWKWP